MLASDAHTLRLSRRHLLAAVLAPAAVTLLAGCSSAVPSQPAPGGAVKPTASASGVARASGTLTLGVSVEPTTLDPQFANSVNEYMFTDNVMQGLFGFDQKVVVTPVLAELHTRVDDNTWEFKLRTGIKFHNGEPLTAEAVKVTFERTNDPNLKIRNTWYRNLNLDDIQVLDDLTLRFHTATPTPQMLARLAKDYPIFPPKYVTQTDAKTVARKPIGTGPYMFKEWSSGEKIVFEANPDYWGTPKPSVKTIVWRWIPEHTSRLANLRTGAVDVMTALDPSAMAEVSAESGLEPLAVGGGRRVYVGLNTRAQPLDDARVRQALNYGADVEGICKTIFGGSTQRMRTWSSPPNENPDVKGYRYDPERARQLLQEAGLERGFEVTLDVDTAGYLKSEEFPPALVTSLRAIGVTVSIKRLDDKVAQQQQRERKTSPMYLRTTTAQYDAALDFDVLRPDHASNATQWDNAEFQTLLKQMYTSGTPDQRKMWAYQAQLVLMDQAPMLFLWKQPEIYGLSKKVRGFAPNGTERFNLAAMSIGH